MLSGKAIRNRLVVSADGKTSLTVSCQKRDIVRPLAARAAAVWTTP